MIGSWILCLLAGHKNETEWEEEFAAGLGPAEVEKKRCVRCGYQVPTGRDRPVEK